MIQSSISMSLSKMRNKIDHLNHSVYHFFYNGGKRRSQTLLVWKETEVGKMNVG